MSLRFCSCTFDVEARRLFRGADEVHLSPKAFETLRALVEVRPRAMSKVELLRRVWPNINVSEVSVARVVNEIRKTLGDDRSGRIIRTVHAHGYAFVAEIEDPASVYEPTSVRRHPIGWLISPTQTLPLHEGEQVVGRDPALNLFLDSPKVSRRHARIVMNGSQALIDDLGSKNGTFVRNTLIKAPTPLQNGDEVRIGRFTFQFRVAEPKSSTETDSLS